MIKDWNKNTIAHNMVFHFAHSLRPFIEVNNLEEDTFFLDIDEDKIYSYYELTEIEGLDFFRDEENEDFLGVDVVCHIKEWF